MRGGHHRGSSCCVSPPPFQTPHARLVPLRRSGNRSGASAIRMVSTTPSPRCVLCVEAIFGPQWSLRQKIAHQHLTLGRELMTPLPHPPTPFILPPPPLPGPQGIVSGLGGEVPGAPFPIKGAIQTTAPSAHQAGGVLIDTRVGGEGGRGGEGGEGGKGGASREAHRAGGVLIVAPPLPLHRAMLWAS